MIYNKYDDIRQLGVYMINKKMKLFQSVQKRAEEYEKQLEEWEKEREEKEKEMTKKLAKGKRIPKYMLRYYKKEEERLAEEARAPEEIEIKREIKKRETLRKIFRKGAYKEEKAGEIKITDITECGKTIDELIDSIKKSRFVTDKPTKDASYEDLQCLMRYAKENPKDAPKIYCKLLEDDPERMGKNM